MTQFRHRAFNDPGALWHIKIGDMILQDGFMHTDPFTYTFAGKIWIPQQWGGEIGMAIAHKLGGLDAMLLGMCTLLAGLFTWLFSRLVRNGMHPVLAFLITGFGIYAGAYHYYARPHMVTLLFMAIVMAILVDLENNRATLWRVLLLIPLGIVWTNIHGGVLGGIFTYGLALAGWVVWWTLKRESTIRSWRILCCHAAVLLAFGLTPWINPFGWEMLFTWKKIVGSSAMKELVSEHQPLSLTHTAGQVTVAFAFLYLMVLVGTLRNWPRMTWLLPLMWFALTLQSIRQGPLFVLVALVAIADMWPRTIWHSLLKKYGDSLARDVEEHRTWRWAVIPVTVVFITLCMQVSGLPIPLLGKGWASLDPVNQPVEVAGELRKYASAHPGGMRIFNDANLGGFVVYHAPTLKIFMDDRFELYGDDWMRQYVTVVYNKPELIEEWAVKYGFDHAVVSVYPDEERLPLEKYLSDSPTWEPVIRGKRGAMFRRLPQSRSLTVISP